MKKIILASQSEGRQELFRKYFGNNYEIIISNAKEIGFDHLNPKELVYFLAKEKAQIIANRHYNNFVCAFDTMVSCENRVLGKPKDIFEAKKMLNFLTNKIQIVWTGYAIAFQGNIFSGTESAELILNMSSYEIQEYIYKYPITKFAGAYAIQKEDHHINIISGDIETIIGAPMKIISQFIKNHQ